jgi:hypothetical protein
MSSNGHNRVCCSQNVCRKRSRVLCSGSVATTGASASRRLHGAGFASADIFRKPDLVRRTGSRPLRTEPFAMRAECSMVLMLLLIPSSGVFDYLGGLADILSISALFSVRPSLEIRFLRLR